MTRSRDARIPVQNQSVNFSTMSTFDEESFKQRVEASLKLVSSILEKNRNPLYPSEVSHKYTDKYLLIQSLYAFHTSFRSLPH